TALFYDTKGAKNYTIHAPLTNTDKYHDTIEGLLLGPSQEILAQHAITYIAKETKLLGLTYSKGIVYVDLSKEFNDEDEKAVNQIEGTLKNFSEVKKVVILKDSSAIKQ
ncbi:MAG: GerMN domain-containing protein, partial [Spirochaetales bacterium]|nr:GerMN domain-containing protein [Spirochaetales bacterium]